MVIPGLLGAIFHRSGSVFVKQKRKHETTHRLTPHALHHHLQFPERSHPGLQWRIWSSLPPSHTSCVATRKHPPVHKAFPRESPQPQSMAANGRAGLPATHTTRNDRPTHRPTARPLAQPLERPTHAHDRPPDAAPRRMARAPDRPPDRAVLTSKSAPRNMFWLYAPRALTSCKCPYHGAGPIPCRVLLALCGHDHGPVPGHVHRKGKKLVASPGVRTFGPAC